MIKIVNGDLLSSDAKIICHQVNCQGVMGSGLAKQIRAKYPHVYTKYKELCNKTKDSRDLLGTIQTISSSPEGMGNGCIFDVLPTIVNVFGQNYYGINGVYTDYNALRFEFRKISIMPLTKNNWYNATIAMPFNIGCGLAGGKWDIVYELLQEEFKYVDLELYKLDLG